MTHMTLTLTLTLTLSPTLTLTLTLTPTRMTPGKATQRPPAGVMQRGAWRRRRDSWRSSGATPFGSKVRPLGPIILLVGRNWWE